MKLQRRPRLTLQKLEARDNPSISLYYTPRELVLTGIPNGELQVNHVAGFPNAFEVLDDGISYGQYLVNNLRIRTPHRPADIVIDLNSTAGNVGRIPGNVEIDLGLGFTDVNQKFLSILDTGAAGPGEIGGRLRISNGNGNEDMRIGIDRSSPAAKYEPIEVGGGVFAVGRTAAQPALSNDRLSIGNGTNVANFIVATSVDTVNVGFPEVGGVNATVAGSVISNNGNSGTGSVLFISGIVGGDALLIGNHREDAVTIQPTDTGVGGTVNGNLTFVAGNSTSGNAMNLNVGSVINGNLTFISGTSVLAPDVWLHQGAINGSAQVLLGNGANTVVYSGDVAGSLTYAGGNQDDTLLMFGGSIAGDVDLGLGHGANTLNFSATVQGGRFNYTAGNGTNTFTYNAVAGSAPYLAINFGSGINTLTLSNQNFSKLSVYAQPLSTNTFNVGFIFTVPVTLVNFPSS